MWANRADPRLAFAAKGFRAEILASTAAGGDDDGDVDGADAADGDGEGHKEEGVDELRQKGAYCEVTRSAIQCDWTENCGE